MIPEPLVRQKVRNLLRFLSLRSAQRELTVNLRPQVETNVSNDGPNLGMQNDLVSKFLISPISIINMAVGVHGTEKTRISNSENICH
jgi:hypothetical protein